MAHRLVSTFFVVASALACACGDSSSPTDPGGGVSGRGAGNGQGSTGGGVAGASNGGSGMGGTFSAGVGGASAGTDADSAAGIGGSSAGTGDGPMDAGAGDAGTVSLEGTLMVTGEDADAFVNASGEFLLELPPSASRTEPPDRIRVTWFGQGSLGGSIRYNEIRTDGGVELVADAAVGQAVTPDTKVGRWVLQTASRTAMEAAGVIVDAATRTVRFTAVELTREGGTTTVVFDGVLPYVP